MGSFFSALPENLPSSNSGTWWQTAIGAGTSVLGTVLDYNLKNKALSTGVISTNKNGSTYATTVGLPGQPVQANLGLNAIGGAQNWGSIIILLIVAALGFMLIKSLVR